MQPEIINSTYELKATCINSDYYNDVNVQPITEFSKNQKQDANLVFSHLSCGNSNNDSCYCGNENSKIFFESPQMTLSDVDNVDYLCNRYIHCASGLLEYRFESINFEYEGNCDENRIQLCSFDLDPEFSGSGRVSKKAHKVEVHFIWPGASFQKNPSKDRI